MTYEGSFDVVIEGVGAERGAKVMAAREGLYVNQHQIPYSTLLGVALRGSILLVVGTQVAMALRGSRDGLASLAAELRGRADLDHLTRSDRRTLEGERVVFATPVAMSGLVEMERFKGMALAVVTDAALHVFERGGRHTHMPWSRINKVDVAQAKFGRLLRIGSGSTQVEFLYLTDAQIQTIRGLATRHSAGLLGVGARKGASKAAAAGQTEAAAEEAPAAPVGDAKMAAPSPRVEDLQRRFSIPEFEASLGGVGTGADRPLGAAIDRLQMSSALPVGFLEEHLRELRSIYDSALLKAKREAAAAQDLAAAAEALEGGKIWSGVQDGIGIIADATVRAFERQVRRIAANRRLPWRKVRAKHMPDDREVAGLRQRLARGVVEMEAKLSAVTAAAGSVKAVMETGGDELRAAYRGWLDALRELDQAYATGWANVSREAVVIWKEVFMPRLTRLAGERRRLLPRPVRIGLLFLVGLTLLFVVYLYFTDQLSGLITFE